VKSVFERFANVRSMFFKDLFVNFKPERSAL
jgi:hypothetical protein